MWEPSELGYGGVPGRVVREGLLEETLELQPGGCIGQGEVELCAWWSVSQVRKKHGLEPVGKRSWQVKAKQMRLYRLGSPLSDRLHSPARRAWAFIPRVLESHSRF